jgi:hypothetical protein
MPDLLAASCLSRKTLERLAHTAYEPLLETRAALDLAMQLLDPEHPKHPKHPKSIASWRDVLMPEELADLLDVTVDNARARFHGKPTWTAGERSKLVRFLQERHARLSQPFVPLATTLRAPTPSYLPNHVAEGRGRVTAWES